MDKRIKHGHNRNNMISPTYRSWSTMRDRCNLKTVNRYEQYGGRGIGVCVRWRKFENFLADMGVRPEGETLDRIDSDQDYSPGNCRWADSYLQNRNRRINKRNKTGIEGVLLKRGKAWEVTISGQYLGWFNDFFEACCSRKSAEAKQWTN